MAKAVTPHSPTTAKILKALGIFGSVQVITVLCSVVRTKLVAIWIGPLGVGLITIYNSTIELMSSVTQCNLHQSAVRDIAQEVDKSRIVAVTRKLALLLGVGGLLLMLLASPSLSYFSFGDTEHAIAFAILSLTMLLSAVTSGESAVMQGLERLKPLARRTMFASVTATAIAVPLFYFFRISGIVPVLIVFAASNCFYSWLLRVRDVERVKVGFRQAWDDGKGMLALGFYMTVSMASSLLASYVFVAWLNHTDGSVAVGVYQAGYTLVNSYVGMIFTAIAMEYYPRLASVVRSRWRTSVVMSHEIKIVLWVLIPVSLFFIAFKEPVIDFLYSDEFYGALPYVGFAIIGVCLRGASVCMAYVIVARGDGRLYVVTELTSAVVYLCLNIPLYTCYGYAGLGVAYVLWYLVYTGVCYAVCSVRYGLRLRRGIGTLLACALCAGGLAFALDAMWGGVAAAVLGCIGAVAAYRRILR